MHRFAIPFQFLLTAILLVAFSSSLQAKNLEGEFTIAHGKTAPAAGSLDKVKYVEVFSITCPHCFNFFKHSESFNKAFGPVLIKNPIEIGWIGENLSRFFYLGEKAGKGLQTEDVLFRAFHEAGIVDLNNPDRLKIFANELKLGSNFLNDMRAPDITKRWVDGTKYVTEYGVTSTPTFILQDSVIVSGSNPANLAKVLNSLLKKPVNYKP